MSEMSAYWLVKLTAIQNSLLGVFVVTMLAVAILLVIFGILYFDYFPLFIEEEKKIAALLPKLKKWLVILSIICGFSALSALFMPNTKDYLMIKGIPLITNEKNIERIDKIFEVFDIKMNEYIKKLKD